MTGIFTGYALAGKINVETGKLLQELRRPACLAVIYDTSSTAACAYASRIELSARELSITLRLLPFSTIDAIAALTEDPEVDAIIPLSPLPKDLEQHALIEAIGVRHDADGQHPQNLGNLIHGKTSVQPPAAKAAMLCATEMSGGVQGRRITVVGASSRVGLPLAMLLIEAGATVSIAHRFTKDLSALTRTAEIVISGTGVAGLIGDEHIAKGAILIDVGIISTPQGLVGDIDVTSVSGRAEALSHVPDGVGPVTTACLMRNVAMLALAHQERE